MLNYSQTLITGDELMFTMDVPYVPAQDSSIVLAQAAAPAPGGTPQPDYILKACSETTSIGDPSSAMRGVDPAGLLAVYIGNRDHRVIYSNPAALASIKTTLLEDTTHGKITSVIDNTGRSWYRYDPIPEYKGYDRAVFMAEFEGKRYKIVVDLMVSPVEAMAGPSSCPPPQLIKINGQPVSGSATDIPTTSSDLSSWLSLAQLDGSLANMTGITVTVADLAGAADNSEFLPTADPNVWMAKAGSAAYGKLHASAFW